MPLPRKERDMKQGKKRNKREAKKLYLRKMLTDAGRKAMDEYYARFHEFWKQQARNERW